MQVNKKDEKTEKVLEIIALILKIVLNFFAK
jgi:hypothetical protein